MYLSTENLNRYFSKEDVANVYNQGTEIRHCVIHISMLRAFKIESKKVEEAMEILVSRNAKQSTQTPEKQHEVPSYYTQLPHSSALAFLETHESPRACEMRVDGCSGQHCSWWP